MTRPSRPALLLALAAAAALPACESDPIVIGTGSRAVLEVSVEPNPVTATQSSIGSVSASYKITITETNGLGGEFVFVNGSVYDPETGKLVATNYYDRDDMTVYVGSKRIEALGSVTLTQSASYQLASLGKAATLVVSVQLKDDRTNLVNASNLFKIE